jgi:flavodoxin
MSCKKEKAMKILIVYYSHSGNNEKLAYELKERIGCGIYKISERKERKTFSILLDFFFNRKAKLSKSDINLKEYDKVIFVAPIWGGRIASPMRGFMDLEKGNLKEYFYITLCNGEVGQKEEIQAELYSILQRLPNGVIELWINSLLPEDKKNKIQHTFKYRISRQDLEYFEKDIELFKQSGESL